MPPALLCLLLNPFLTASAAGPEMEIPFAFLHNQILLEAEVNGTGPFNFVLDSGTFSSTVSLRLARQLRLPLESRRTLGVGAGKGRILSRRTVLDKLNVGDLTILDFPVVALDLAAPSKQFGRPLDGVLGYGFLSGRIVQIDYFHRRVRIFRQSPFPLDAPPENTKRRLSFPMQFLEGSVLPVLEDCYVNGFRLPVTIDTGSSLGLILFPQAIQRLGLEKLAREGLSTSASGYGGAARLTKGWVKSLVLGNMDLGAVEVAYVRSGYGEGEQTERRGGNLGNALLQEFVVTLDYRNHRVVIEVPAE